MSAAQSDPTPHEDSILSITPYSPSRLRDLLLRSHRSNATKYEAYLARRRSGGPREMFPTTAHAKEWIRLAAVVKYVDGGWLGGVLVNEHPRAAEGEGSRKSAKMAWQVMSEEYGDGDLAKNHVDLYYRLVDSLGLAARPKDPSDSSGSAGSAGSAIRQGHALHGWDRGFDGLQQDQGVPRCWTAALAQLCIGLLAAYDHLPEALGFNMSYETLPYHLLVTTHELRELGIDDTYFALHITIDNLHTGHAALSRLAVEAYMASVPPHDREKEWARVQRGFVLADGLPTTPWGPVEFEPTSKGWRPRPAPSAPTPTPTSAPLRGSSSRLDLGLGLGLGVPQATPHEMDMARLLAGKAQAAEKMHCPSRVRIRGNTIEQWLEPTSMSFPKALEFARGLAGARPWVYPGEPGKSRLVKEIEWGGRMFGAFSRQEVAVVRRWIESLSSHHLEASPEVRQQGPSHGPTLSLRHETSLPQAHSLSAKPDSRSTIVDTNLFDQLGESNPTSLPTLLSTLSLLPSPSHVNSNSDIAHAILASLTMLDHFTLSPTRLATPLGMCVIRILRAQLGFPSLHNPADICAGTDHFSHEPHSPGADGSEDLTEDVVGIYELVDKSRLDFSRLSTSDKCCETPWSVVAALRRRPYANAGILLGILAALLPLHMSLTALLSDEVDRHTLRRIVEEERQALLDYWAYLDCQPEGHIDQRRIRGGFVWATANLLNVL